MLVKLITLFDKMDNLSRLLRNSEGLNTLISLRLVLGNSFEVHKSVHSFPADCLSFALFVMAKIDWKIIIKEKTKFFFCF